MKTTAPGKLQRVYSYLFNGYEFDTGPFDYDEYWQSLLVGGEHPASRYKLKLLESLIDEGSSVLDIGCGDGSMLYHLEKAKGTRGQGVDLSHKATALARIKGLDVVQADITAPEFQLTATYDYIIISEVLEHLARPEDLLLKLKGRFSKRLLVTVPNSGFLGERLRLLFGRAPKQWVYHPSEHLRFWTVPDFLLWVRQLGLEVEEYRGLLDEYYDVRLPLWRYRPRLFSRYILYLIRDGS